MRLEIKAVDNLFFRDGKPFSLGEESWANGVFPPAPSTFKGMLISAYMSQKGLSPAMAYKLRDSIQIKGTYLAIKKRLHFPLPADIINLEDHTDGYNAMTLKLRENKFSSNVASPFILRYGGKDKLRDIIGETIISQNTLEDYLKGVPKGLSYKQLNDFLTLEPKVGIGRNCHMHIVNEGELYRVNMIRPVKKKKGLDLSKRINFIVDAELPQDFESSGSIRFGAEGKVVSFNELEEHIIERGELKEKRFRLYLASPAIFEKGWLPYWLRKDGTFGVIDIHGEAIRVKFLACAMGKRQRQGGFDMQLGIPKPMFSTVPAGSVFYLEAESVEDANIIARYLHTQCIAELGWAKDGFGLVYVGNVAYEY